MSTGPVSQVPVHVHAASAEQTRVLGAALAGVVDAGDVVLLTGDLGAGKTTFTQGLGEGLGVRGPVTSPTYVIARVHPSLVAGPLLVHVDAYRLGTADEVDDLDLDDTLATAVTVVEWGRDRAEQLSDSYLLIEFAHRDDGRTITMTGHGPRWAGDTWQRTVTDAV